MLIFLTGYIYIYHDLFEGMVRISIGIDNDINRTFEKMKNCMKSIEIL